MTFRSAAVLILFGLISSCAEGGGATLPISVDGGSSGTSVCGNGVIDGPTEVCECPVGSTGPCVVQGQDCSALDATKTGPLMCDQTMCMFLEDLCMSSTGVAGSSGGGTGG